MREILLKFSTDDVYGRTIGNGMFLEIQTLNGGIIVYRPTIRMTLLGVVLTDHTPGRKLARQVFTHKTKRYEQSFF